MPVRKAPASPEPKPRLRHLNETLFTSLAQARVATSLWRADYNTARPHSSLGYQTPATFAGTLPQPDPTLRSTKATCLQRLLNPRPTA